MTLCATHCGIQGNDIWWVGAPDAKSKSVIERHTNGDINQRFKREDLGNVNVIQDLETKLGKEDFTLLIKTLNVTNPKTTKFEVIKMTGLKLKGVLSHANQTVFGLNKTTLMYLLHFDSLIQLSAQGAG